ncbi:MAG: ATP-dependent RNA helicase RhlB [Gammaproteobacteria bacterium]|nr:MAG: ATP-dependent RNA helicase RhlB [Gammaproteobacteria bacterium]
MSDTHLTKTRFDSLNLAPELLKGIESTGFTYCTPIQALSLPHALAGKDIAGQAQTGTGKSAAFLLAAMNLLLTKPAHDKRRVNQPRAIMLAPTRELAIQIEKDAKSLGQYSGLRIGVVYGGAGYVEQRTMLEEGLDILIGTPGRMIDYFKQHVFDLKALDVMVLDEADRMFDLGFIDDIRYLMRRMPKPDKRLNMLFSATLSHRVAELAYEHMNNPVEVEIEPDQKTVDRVRQVVYYTAMSDKIPLLIGLLKHEDLIRTILFVNTKRVAEKVSAYLEGNDISNAVLSGDVPQKKRLSLLEKFSRGDLPVLVATDVAARGLHIPDVSHVINYDLPNDPEDYVHRIGRTARAGAEGDAISFACEEYAYHLPEIEEYIGHKIDNEAFDSELLIEPKPPAKRKPRPHKGKHSGKRSGKHSSNKSSKSGHRRGQRHHNKKHGS